MKKNIKTKSGNFRQFNPFFHNTPHTLYHNQQNISHPAECNIGGAPMEHLWTFPITEDRVAVPKTPRRHDPQSLLKNRSYACPVPFSLSLIPSLTDQSLSTPLSILSKLLTAHHQPLLPPSIIEQRAPVTFPYFYALLKEVPKPYPVLASQRFNCALKFGDLALPSVPLTHKDSKSLRSSFLH